MFLLKLLLSNLIIVACVVIGRRWPTFGGLIATMPLTSLIVLVWLYSENPDQPLQIEGYVRGVLWGIAPTIAFFAALLFLLRKGAGVPVSLFVGAAFWLAGALLHRIFIKF